MKRFYQFINESVSDYSFKTDVKDVTIYGLEEFLNKKDDVDITTSASTVSWILEPEMRNDRIKSMNLGVIKVWCQIEYSFDDVENIIYFDTDSQDFKDWTIDSQIEFGKDGSVCPYDVEIDYRSKKVTII
jgi:hypothetical protein